MLRFILNFFIFGLLFYLIYLFFPETFQTLLSWANQTYEFFRELFLQISGKVQSSRGGNNPPPQQTLGYLSFMSAFLSR